MRGGDAELRPTGTRTVWLDDFDLPDEIWASFGIPIGLAFFIDSSVTGGVVALYPSPAGATESELELDAWRELRTAEPGADGPRARRRGADRQPDGRPAPARDRADRRVLPAGRRCQGRAGRGSPAAPGSERAIAGFFDELRERARERSDRRQRPRRRRGRARRRSPARPTPSSSALRAAPVERAAAPTLSFTRPGHRRRPARRVFTIALTARDHDRALEALATTTESRERLIELFGEPERWASTTTNFRWAQVDALVPAFDGRDRVRARRPVHLRPRARRGQVLRRARRRRGAAALPLQRHGLLRGRRRADADRPDPLGPLAALPDAGRGLARRRSTPPTRTAAGCRSHAETLDAARAAQGRARAADLRRRGRRAARPRPKGRAERCASSSRRSSPRCSTRATRSTRTRRGRPRTRPRRRSGSSTRRPTPSATPTTFDHLRVECVLAAEPEARGARRRSASCRPSGERHEAVERRLELGPALARRRSRPTASASEFEFDGEQPLRGPRAAACRAARRARPRRGSASASTTRPTVEAAASSSAPEALLGEPALDPRRARDRAAAGSSRRSSATAPRARRSQACANVNTFPVLAAPDDDAILGGADRAPRPPELAPESLGNLFDNTEIEEALLLHVQALSDDEREADRRPGPGGAGDDRAGRSERRPRRCSPCTAGSTPIEPTDARGCDRAPGARDAARPGPAAGAGPPEPGRGRARARRGRLPQGRQGDPAARAPTATSIDRMLDGRTATIERLYLDYEDGAHVAVTSTTTRRRSCSARPAATCSSRPASWRPSE